MNIGDPVIPASSDQYLSSGNCLYSFAIVASLNPFILVSSGGDMKWTLKKAEDFRVASIEVSGWMLRKVKARLESENLPVANVFKVSSLLKPFSLRHDVVSVLDSIPDEDLLGYADDIDSGVGNRENFAEALREYVRCRTEEKGSVQDRTL